LADFLIAELTDAKMERGSRDGLEVDGATEEVATGQRRGDGSVGSALS
jgi:hypothetical protein